MISGVHTQVEPSDYEEVDIADTAVGLTSEKVTASDVVLVRFELGPVRYRVDGTAPDATTGFPGYDGNSIELSSTEKRKFKAIRTGAVSGKLRCIYYKHQTRP